MLIQLQLELQAASALGLLKCILSGQQHLLLLLLLLLLVIPFDPLLLAAGFWQHLLLLLPLLGTCKASGSAWLVAMRGTCCTGTVHLGMSCSHATKRCNLSLLLALSAASGCQCSWTYCACTCRMAQDTSSIGAN